MFDEFPRLICEYCDYKIRPGSKYLKLDEGAFCVCKLCVDKLSVSDLLEVLGVEFETAND